MWDLGRFSVMADITESMFNGIDSVGRQHLWMQKTEERMTEMACSSRKAELCGPGSTVLCLNILRQRGESRKTEEM